ncbi:hypothetical protein [Oscillatoria sp. HE19RPO]|nr:hypothetical protein [Oscillatoria sp. HE19RPO]
MTPDLSGIADRPLGQDLRIISYKTLTVGLIRESTLQHKGFMGKSSG